MPRRRGARTASPCTSARTDATSRMRDVVALRKASAHRAQPRDGGDRRDGRRSRSACAPTTSASSPSGAPRSRPKVALDVVAQRAALAAVARRLADGGIRVSACSSTPTRRRSTPAPTLGAAAVELHTGRYCEPLAADGDRRRARAHCAPRRARARPRADGQRRPRAHATTTSTPIAAHARDGRAQHRPQHRRARRASSAWRRRSREMRALVADP